MVKFYIATRINRTEDHNSVRDALLVRGHQITYDWTTHKDKPRFESTAALRVVGVAMIKGVEEADVTIVLLPGGGGTHVELGVALSLGKQVLIHSEEAIPFQLGPETKAFYHHPLVTQVISSFKQLQPLLDAFIDRVDSTVVSLNT